MIKEKPMDDAIILKLKESPACGLELAIDKYGGAIKTICTNILGYNYPEDIEECIADVFVDLWKNIDKYAEDKGNFKSYIYGIARHKAIDRFRKEGHKRNYSILEEDDIQINMDFTDEIAKKMNASIMQETIDALPSPDKEIFVYRYYFYEKVNAIAQNLGLSPKMVENKLHRGKIQLRSQLLERGIVI